MAGDRSADEAGPRGAPYPSLWEFPPPAARVEVTLSAHSQPRPEHAQNTDHYAIFRAGRNLEMLSTSLPDAQSLQTYYENGYAMVVADGLGHDGETASRIAVATLWHLLLHFGKWNLRIDDEIAREVMDRVNRFYRHVDNAVVHQGLGGARPGPQTTLTGIFGAGRDLFIAHVGHSRAYLSRDRVLMRLTRDHTLGAKRSSRAAPAPLMEVNQSARDLQHILTSTMGIRGQAGPAIDVERFQILDDDRVLVCTNGLTDAVDEQQVSEILASDRSPEDLTRALVEAARAANAEDDVTVLAARYRVPR